MRILFIGDIFGRCGRSVVNQWTQTLRADLHIDAVVANAENSAGGFGITPSVCQELLAGGIDVLTGGNHSWDKKEIIPYIPQESRLLRPLNYPQQAPGRGTHMCRTRAGGLYVVNLMGQLFMPSLNDPFASLEKALGTCKLGEDAAAIVVDFHAEATSEKVALAHAFDGRVSLVVGTHTHCPTSDHRILPGGSGFMSDVGMCGDYDSVLGLEKTNACWNYRRKMREKRPVCAAGEPTFCALLLDTDPNTGLATRLWPIRLGGVLSQSRPPDAHGTTR